MHGGWSPSSRRAWIEIWLLGLSDDPRNKSPSSRRAWIEILANLFGVTTDYVALLAEGVDRNRKDGGGLCKIGQSPSSRRAWIEMP